jgi:thiamine biosynthesis lipoprotein
MNAAIDAAFDAISAVHNLMSFHESESDVGRLNRLAWAQPVHVHAWTWQVLDMAADLHRRSAGAFDVTVASVLQDLGLLPRHHAERPSTATHKVTAADIELLPGRRVRFKHRETRIDLGGIAKGFAVDCAMRVLHRHGMRRALINAGGDIAAFGPDPCGIDVRHPRDPSRAMCRISLRDTALASSGSYFDPFVSSEPVGSAVIDPRSRHVVQTVAGATVRAHSCMLADALTKVVMVAGRGAGQLLDDYGADAIIVYADGGMETTCGLQTAVRLAA